ncbi:TonB-dependent receptor plug domain-containing protein [Aureisphaera galaxeae]|uniref:TonB-dependent receptor plug domain-containing protein n=1 Tax=Aureisphaera galaxeae TaxID=1538023 RepID=UPI002350B715|nr:TonB-dependent receptor plug domain-containing protein [Aureisphaera galaxeae]MDC8004029.1 TonB-dependent receptor plug domain-containing protein [Aureisphaera galaxeae]
MLKKIACLVFLCIASTLWSQEKITIAWDVSLSMEHRNTEKEFQFLNNYFTKYPNVKARVILFNGIQSNQEDFSIENGNWQAIRTKLSQVIYDGGTGYQKLITVWLDGTTFLFTDGMENIEEDLPPMGKQLYVINSASKKNLKNLQFLALSNKGRFVDLSPPPQWGDSQKEKVQGYIYGLDVPMDAITIRVKDTKVRTSPDDAGNFEIQAVPGDVVVFEAVGVQPIERIVTPSRTLNVWMEYDGIELGEVFLKKKKKKKEGSEKVITSNKKQQKRAVGYGMTTVNSEDFNQAAVTISEAVLGRLSGLRGTQLETSVIRGRNSLVENNYPLIILDDVPLPIGESTDFINPVTIASVTVLKGFAATTIYGSEASGGAIVLKTKMSVEREKAEAREREAKEFLSRYDNVDLLAPAYSTNYLSDLENTASLDGAYSLYLKQRKAHLEKEPAFAIDLFDFFATRNTRMAKTIGYNILEMHGNDLSAMRTMLFKAREKHFFDMELHFAKALIVSFPDRIQSYLDLAMAQKSNGNYQAALDILLGVTTGDIRPNLDFNPLRKMADQEIRNLISQHKESLETSKIEATHLSKEPLEARLVFDWSAWESDFEFVFISPDGHYTQWNHTMAEPERLKEELDLGYSQEEFEIAGGDKGKWKVIVKYLGSRSQKNIPEYIRCTIQYNFGKENERTEEHMIHFFEEGSEYLAFSLETHSG